MTMKVDQTFNNGHAKKNDDDKDDKTKKLCVVTIYDNQGLIKEEEKAVDPKTGRRLTIKPNAKKN